MTNYTTEYFEKKGRKGGKSKSQKKLKAINVNLIKARAARWPKEKQDGQ